MINKYKFFFSIIFLFFLKSKIIASSLSNEDKDLENTISNVVSIIKNNSIHEIKDEVLLSHVLNALMGNINDKYASFLDADYFKQYNEVIDANYVGLGIYIIIKDGYPIILFLTKDAPADLSKKIQAGDQIMEINNKETKGFSYEEILKRLRNKKKSYVLLKIKRGDEILEVKLERKSIKVDNVKYDWLTNDIGYILIKFFYKNLLKDMKDILQVFKKNSVKHLIIDLRDNPGGSLKEVIGLIDLFLKNGRIFSLRSRAKMDGKVKNKEEVYYANLSTYISDTVDIILLVNSGTASASEIFSAALQDANRAWVIGERTFGKGLSQYVIPIFFKGKTLGIRLTVNEIYMPLGYSFNERGIVPDIFIHESKKVNIKKMNKIFKIIEDHIINSIIENKTFDIKKIFNFLLKDISDKKLKISRFQLYRLIHKFDINNSSPLNVLSLEEDIFLKKALKWIKEIKDQEMRKVRSFY